MNMLALFILPVLSTSFTVSVTVIPPPPDVVVLQTTAGVVTGGGSPVSIQKTLRGGILFTEVVY